MIRAIIAIAIRCALALRYRITIRGLDKVRGKRGVLILPNHPAEMDPVILGSHLWADFQPHPVVVEDFFNAPGLGWLMHLTGAIPMPNMESGVGSYKRMRVRRSIAHMASLIARGENVLVYPAGRLMRSGNEDLRATSATFDILAENPDMDVILVRTRGLIGSSFSWVAHQKRPPLGTGLLRGAWHIALNLVLFTPRRPITITIDTPGPDFPRDDKMAMNRWLESWYNEDGPEQPSLISYNFWRKHYFELADNERSTTTRTLDIPDDVRSRVMGEIARLCGKAIEDINENDSLARDLGLDSLVTAELVTWLDEEFYVGDVDNTDITTVYDVLAAAIGSVGKTTHTVSARLTRHWFEPSRPTPQLPDTNKTIPHNFLLTSQRLRGAVALADETRGVITYTKARIAVLVLAEVIRRYPEKHIGVMLPAAVGTNLVTMAVMLAGKIPVMVNWTVGDANLHHVINAAGLTRILTAGRFLDRLEQVNVEHIEEYLVPLETLAKAEINLATKLRALWQHMRGTTAIMTRLGTSQAVDDTAVILFTSGSESVPKGVPLSHRNIVHNISGSLEAAGLHIDKALDVTPVIYGFLPPFHSFGFTVTSMLPMITGLKAAYYPNPTETRKLVHGIALWKPSIICGTPTFAASIFKTATRDQLSSLRLILAGAEKTPAELFETVTERSQAELLEGYGITECSPVLTINRPGTDNVGVGKSVGDVEICIVDLDTHTPLATGERGLIVVRGSTIFSGYLSSTATDPFITVNGQQWYNTGDLGFVDNAGNLTLAGRLKRFVKIGGEMISLPAMEDAIRVDYPDGDDGAGSALAYLERDGQRPVLALFTVHDTDIDTINQLLKDAGFSNLARIHHVVRVDAIPLLGTGKTDYVSLTSQLKSTLGEQL